MLNLQQDHIGFHLFSLKFGMEDYNWQYIANLRRKLLKAYEHVILRTYFKRVPQFVTHISMHLLRWSKPKKITLVNRIRMKVLLKEDICFINSYEGSLGKHVLSSHFGFKLTCQVSKLQKPLVFTAKSSFKTWPPIWVGNCTRLEQNTVELVMS